MRTRSLATKCGWTRRCGSVAWLTVGLVLLNLAWRSVRYGLGFPLWGDEAFLAMSFVLRSFSEMVDPLEYGQIAPLGFMWAELAVTRVFGLSECGLRLLPFAAGVLSMLLFWGFARMVLNRWGALLAVAVFAASYYTVRHGTEVKPYSTDLLTSLALLYVGWSVYLHPESWRRWGMVIVLAGASPWLSYPSLFVAGGVGLLLAYLALVRRSPRVIGLCLIYGVCLCASFTAMFLIYSGPHAAVPWKPGSPGRVVEMAEAFPPLNEPWRLPYWLLDIHTGNLLAYPVGGKHGGSTLTFLLVLVGIGRLWRKRPALLIVLLGPLLFNFIAAAMQRYPYGSSVRFSLHVAPAFCLLAGVGLLSALKTCLPARKVSGGIRVAALIMAAIPIAGAVADILHPYKILYDLKNKRAIQWMAERTGPNDQWVSFNVADPDVTYADNFYLRSGDAARHRFYLYRLKPVPIHWAPRPTEVSAPSGGRIWLVTYKNDRAPFPEDLLAAYVDALAERFGKPERHLFPLGKNEAVVEIYEYPRSPCGTGILPVN